MMSNTFSNGMGGDGRGGSTESDKAIISSTVTTRFSKQSQTQSSSSSVVNPIYGTPTQRRQAAVPTSDRGNSTGSRRHRFLFSDGQSVNEEASSLSSSWWSKAQPQAATERTRGELCPSQRPHPSLRPQTLWVHRVGSIARIKSQSSSSSGKTRPQSSAATQDATLSCNNRNQRHSWITTVLTESARTRTEITSEFDASATTQSTSINRAGGLRQRKIAVYSRDSPLASEAKRTGPARTSSANRTQFPNVEVLIKMYTGMLKMRSKSEGKFKVNIYCVLFTNSAPIFR